MRQKTALKNGKIALKPTQKQPQQAPHEDVAIPEIRTTQATYWTPEPAIPLFRNGCQSCHEKSLVTEQKIRTWRVCRCRVCGWRGEMEG